MLVSTVALRKESVDRNGFGLFRRCCLRVALRKESVDRNVPFNVIRPAIDVALRKESVDRNCLRCHGDSMIDAVALRKESVDRNLRQVRLFGLGLGSLSARRAWIEIIDQLAH